VEVLNETTLTFIQDRQAHRNRRHNLRTKGNCRFSWHL